MANELTYILGAGASFQSIPIVKTFNKRLQRFSDYLKEKSREVGGIKKNRLETASNIFRGASQEFSSHQSFDTYFKKLFHLGEVSEINNGKRLLHLYFLWEHSPSSLLFDKNIQDRGNNEFVKYSLFDTRYDGLIAGLLKPVVAKSEPMCKVNFISWNYDMNLLYSIKNFFYPKITYKEFLEKGKRNQFLWEIDDKFKIININGFFYSSGFDNSINLMNLNIDSIIEDKIFNEYYFKKEIDEDANKIKFAWEIGATDNKSLQVQLTSLLSSCNDLIIIGYTFPVYNRIVDFGFISQHDLINKRIIIQDPLAETRKQNIMDMYGLTRGNNIHPINDCDSFYIPSKIFTIDDFTFKFKPIV